MKNIKAYIFVNENLPLRSSVKVDLNDSIDELIGYITNQCELDLEKIDQISLEYDKGTIKTFIVNVTE